jgi:carboxylesterase type B
VVEDRYPLSAYRSARQALAAIVSDREWAWPAEESDDLFARHVPTYSYEFTDRRRAAPLFPYPDDLPAGASHGSELGYLFDRLGRPNDLDQAQRALANRMIRYWARFTRAADPNHPGLPRWPRYRPMPPPRASRSWARAGPGTSTGPASTSSRSGRSSADRALLAARGSGQPRVISPSTDTSW